MTSKSGKLNSEIRLCVGDKSDFAVELYLQSLDGTPIVHNAQAILTATDGYVRFHVNGVNVFEIEDSVLPVPLATRCSFAGSIGGSALLDETSGGTRAISLTSISPLSSMNRR
jgi:hypothetical protein